MKKEKKLKIPKPRGIDFLINWSMGSWSEDRVLEAINDTGRYIAVRYGISRVGPFSFEEYAKYYQRLRQRVYLHGKRPDLIVFDLNTYQKLKQELGSIVDNLMDVPDNEADTVVKEALFGVEVEVSKWHVGKMLEYQEKQGKRRRKSSIMGPTFTIKEEDIKPLIRWVTDFNKEIVVVQTFYDRAYAITFSDVRNLIERKESIEGVKAEVDKKTKKMTCYISCLKYGILFGEFNPIPSVQGKVLIDEKGQLWPMVEFVDGKLIITEEGLKLLDKVSRGH